ncbi:metallophosphoesterase [Frisingicoccus sp.]|uniref:metallophosphoesterase family protein n=1 Tax=Frisingicoccus sp. TaxID=1918627 RepID=UPI0015BB0A84
MKVLAISDVESPYYWDYFEQKKLDDIDLILACGDLDPEYLSFLATFSHGPLLYVHGNHDAKYADIPPEGCICVDNKIYVYQGIRIFGLGGSMHYCPGEYQYTEWEMKKRILRMKLSIVRHHGFDILMTHAPAYQLGDGEDLPHQGFQIFRTLLDEYRPRYFVHGHVHPNYNLFAKRQMEYGETKIYNAYERFVFEY